MGGADVADVVVKPSLWKKLSDVMGAVRGIKKDGRNDHHKFDFVSHDAVVAAIAQQLPEVGLAFSVEMVDFDREPTGSKDRSGNAAIRYVVKSRYRFTCLDTGESQEYLWLGEGVDSQDKGLYKAITQSKKTFLLNIFLVATGDKYADGDHGVGYEYSRSSSKNAVGKSSPSRPDPRQQVDGNPQRNALKRALFAAMKRNEPCDEKGNPVWNAVAKTVQSIPGLPEFNPIAPSTDDWTEEQLKTLLGYYNSLEEEA